MIAMTNKPMLSIELRALLERLLSHDFAEECQECGIGYSDAWSELSALLDADKVNSREMGLMQYVDAHPIKSAKTDLVECDACPTSGGCVSVCMKAPKTAAQHQGHAIPQWLRDHFSAIEDEAMKLGGCGVFTQMRTKVQAYFEMVRGEPIYQVMYRGDGGGGWCDAEKASYDMKVPHPKHWQARIVYAEQPAPVADKAHD